MNLSQPATDLLEVVALVIRGVSDNRDLSLRPGMTATAEGVETHDQLERVTSEGCTEMQGFLFSRPMPAYEIEQWLLFGGQLPRAPDRCAVA